jgi:hypothetical protein
MIRATNPMVRPTAAAVDNFSLDVAARAVPAALGGAVGVTVTVRTWPVTVSSEMTGVGVQVKVPSDPGLR